MNQLMRQSKVFHSMKARYEMQLQELKVEVSHATEEKEQMLKDIRPLVSAAHSPLKDINGASLRAAEEANKGKAHLEGRLQEVNRQLAELKRRQIEAQRLIRLKEQQEAQIGRMRDEIMRLKGQKQ